MSARILFVVATTLISAITQAEAKATFACRGEVEVGGRKSPTESQAKSSARSRWIDLVGSKYGASWAQISRATGQHYTCRGNWYCEFAAKPCGPVTPHNLSERRNSKHHIPAILD